MLQRCRKCTACIEGCPRGAIGRGRFLLRAEECYTLFSESLEAIPDNVEPPSPNCLVGCMKCQEICPENEGLLKYERIAESFTSEETAALLGNNEPGSPVLEKAVDKLRSLELSEELGVYVRNLRRILGMD